MLKMFSPQALLKQKRDFSLFLFCLTHTHTHRTTRLFQLHGEQAHETSSNEDNKYLWIPTSFTLINITQMLFFFLPSTIIPNNLEIETIISYYNLASLALYTLFIYSQLLCSIDNSLLFFQQLSSINAGRFMWESLITTLKLIENILMFMALKLILYSEMNVNFKNNKRFH